MIFISNLYCIRCTQGFQPLVILNGITLILIGFILLFTELSFKVKRYRTLKKRKKILGERFTSDLTTRKFESEQFFKLNSNLEKNEIISIYKIGWANGNTDMLSNIRKIIKSKSYTKLNTLQGKGVQWQLDELGETPTGTVGSIYLLTNINYSTFQVITSDLTTSNKSELVINIKTEIIRYDIFNKRQLIFPV